MFKLFASLFLSVTTLFSGVTHTTTSFISQVTGHNASTRRVALTQDQLLAMAGNLYANGGLPLGDNKYVTSGPKQGYIYLCTVPQNGGGGAQGSGSWLGTSTWTETGKPKVQGSVSFPNATFSNTISGNTRTLTGNGLPVGMTTGIFPIGSTDPAYQYDRNPNTITAQTLNLSLPVNPTYSDTPYCMGMEVGIMLDGVPLFNGFDAELRDAAAHEVQDSCDAHPQEGGEYHYHSLSSCFSDISETTVLGFALDGFPITGPKVADGKYLTTANLDECHGITSEINLDGKTVTMYHYVMTQDFPYSVSCFRGKPVSYQVINTGDNGGQGKTQEKQAGSQSMQGPNSQMQIKPPQQAYDVCSGKTVGTSCSFTAPRGTVSGTCQNPSGQSELCVPTMPEQNAGTSRPQNY